MFGTFKSCIHTWPCSLILSLIICSVCICAFSDYNSPTQCLETITQSHSQNRKGEKKKRIIYISHPAMF